LSITSEIDQVPELSTKVLDMFADYMNAEDIVREASLATNSIHVVEKRKALAELVKERQVREKAEAQVALLKARLAEMERKYEAI
jgi:hypothetical protein